MDRADSRLTMHADSTQAVPARRAAEPHPRSGWLIVAVTVVAGGMLGLSDLLVQRALPYPWANLANSGAVWAAGAFMLGMWIGPWAARAAAAGCGLLIIAVEAYYLSAVVVQSDSVSDLWTDSTLAWLVYAVAVGALFGAAGAVTASPRRSVRLAGTGLIGLVFLAEAVHILRRPADTDDPSANVHTALIEFALAIAVPLIVWLTRPRRHTTDAAR